MRIVDFLWSGVTATGATVGLAIVGLSGEVLDTGWLRDAIEDNRTLMISVFAIFLIYHSYRNWKKERAQSRGVLGNFENIQNNVLHLISDLADLVGKQYHLWVIDLYVKETIFCCSRRWPFFASKVLEKKLSIALSDVSEMPGMITREDALFGSFVARDEPKLWWDQELILTLVDAQNAGEGLSTVSNDKLKKRFGVVKVWPITDDLSKNYKGILVIHARRDVETATAALGVLAGGQADRLCFRAGQNIQGQLKK